MGVTVGVRSYIYGENFKKGVPNTAPVKGLGMCFDGVTIGVKSCVRIEFFEKGYPVLGEWFY